LDIHFLHWGSARVLFIYIAMFVCFANVGEMLFLSTIGWFSNPHCHLQGILGIMATLDLLAPTFNS
jgi:hypothetical protein